MSHSWAVSKQQSPPLPCITSLLWDTKKSIVYSESENEKESETEERGASSYKDHPSTTQNLSPSHCLEACKQAAGKQEIALPKSVRVTEREGGEGSSLNSTSFDTIQKCTKSHTQTYRKAKTLR